MADLTFTDHGTIVTMRPDTDAGRDWIADNIPDDAMTFGGAIVIERRYTDNIINGAAADGLEVST